MKANRSIKLDEHAEWTGIVTGIVALLLAIIVGILVYFSVQSNVGEFASSTSQTFTSDSDSNSFTRYDGSTGSNYTGEVIKLSYEPYSFTSVEAWNGSGAATTLSAGSAVGNYQFNGRLLTINADTTGATLGNFTQVNVTYVTQASNTVNNEVTPMATTIFNLLPVIALVVVAGVILAVVLGFGGKRET